MIQSEIRKFETSCKSSRKNRNFLKVRKCKIPEHGFSSTYFLKIVSSLRIKNLLSFDQNSNPFLSIEGYKNDSLCLDTLYVTASSCERYILTCEHSKYLQEVCKTFSGFYVTASGCERYILTCERSDYLQISVRKSFPLKH